jgi:hypothetical protein
MADTSERPSFFRRMFKRGHKSVLSASGSITEKSKAPSTPHGNLSSAQTVVDNEFAPIVEPVSNKEDNTRAKDNFAPTVEPASNKEGDSKGTLVTTSTLTSQPVGIPTTTPSSQGTAANEESITQPSAVPQASNRGHTYQGRRLATRVVRSGGGGGFGGGGDGGGGGGGGSCGGGGGG